MRKSMLTGVACLALLTGNAQTATLQVDAAHKGVQISPTLYGLFYEEINHAGEGGLYAELIQNRSFEDVFEGHRNQRFGANNEGERFGRRMPEGYIPAWILLTGEGTAATMEATDQNLLNEVQKKALKLTVTQASATARPGVANVGFWGIEAVKGDVYKLSFWAKADKPYKGEITVGLQNEAGTEWYGKTVLKGGLTKKWKKYTANFTPTAGADYARFALTLSAPGTIYLDMVSLFPPTFKNRENGCRKDLAEMLEAMHPRFMRFPGGCFVEGMSRESAYEWKRTVGPLERRPGHMNENWHYPVTDGMGFHEYLQLAEDLGAEPLYVVNVGIWHGGFQPYNQIDEYIQNALDAIEYANGDASTTYGKMRIKNGHPAPFSLRLIEVGNENYQRNAGEQSDHYAERYAQFYKAIKAKYPDVQIIGNVESWGTDYPTWRNEHPVDLLDEHYYRSPSWFAGKYHHYDKYDRKGPKIYTGEYAVTSDCGEGNLKAALGEAIFMMGMENNSDVVTMCSYAPIFVNIHDRRWMPDMIRFDAANSWGSPSYYTQKLLANHVGTHIVKSEITEIQKAKPTQCRIGLGSWNTQVEYKEVKVTDTNGKVLYEENFAQDPGWTSHGSWSVKDGVYAQTSLETSCTSVSPVAFDSKAYTYTVKARKTGGDEGFLILFDYTGEGNYLWLNIAGWGNTQHAVERMLAGSKTTIDATGGKIENNIWYDLRIEVRGEQVACFLNNRKVSEFTLTAPKMMFANAMLNEPTRELIVKVVNFDDCLTPLKIDVANAEIKSCELTLLTSASGTDENTFKEQEKVVPQTTNCPMSFKESLYMAPGNSLSILRMKLK